MSTEKRGDLLQSYLDTVTSLLSTLSPEDQARFVDSLSAKFKQERKQMITIPHSIFTNTLSCYEALVLYLHDYAKISLKEVGRLLLRSHSSAIQTYKKAQSKVGTLDISQTEFSIPLDVFSTSKVGIQEQVVGYLREHYQLKFTIIAEILSRDYNTVKTAYYKYRKKVNSES